MTIPFLRRRGRRPGSPAPGGEASAAAPLDGVADASLLLVPTESADCRRAVDGLAAAASLAGRTVLVTPPHRLEAVAATSHGTVVLLTATPVRAVLDGMRRGIMPSVGLRTALAAAAAARAAAERHAGRAHVLDIAAVEDGTATLPGLGRVAGSGGAIAGAEPENADPVLALVAAAAAAGIGDADRWDAAFRRHVALREEAHALAREAAAWTRGQLSGGEETARLRAALAVAEAERERLRGDVARLEDALREGVSDETARPRRYEVDITGAAILHPAFYDAERAGERPFRWLGREAEARIATAVPRRSAVRVDVTVEMAISRATLEGFRIGMDGTEPAAVSIAPLDRGRALVSATFPADRGAPRLARRELRLTAGTRADLSATGDPRTLAVAIGSIVLEELDDGAVGVVDGGALAVPAAPSAAGDATAGAAAIPAAAGTAAPARAILLEQLSHPAFHAAERHPDGRAFRWLARPAADIAVRLPRSVPVRVTVAIVAATSPEALSRVSLAVDGVAAGAVATMLDGAGGGEASALFLLAGPRSAGERVARLTVSAPVADLSGAGDARPASVAVHSVRIEEAPGAAGATPVPAPPPFSVALEAATALATPAFWTLENAGGRPFRWFGRGDRASFPLVLPPGRGVAVAAELVGTIDDAALDGFEISLGDGPAAEASVERRGDGTLVKTALVPAAGATGGPVALSLHARHRRPPGGPDQRMLAVAVSRITVDAL